MKRTKACDWCQWIDDEKIDTMIEEHGRHGIYSEEVPIIYCPVCGEMIKRGE